MRSLKKQKEQSCEERWQVLVEEINEIREKISQLDELQQQIETIEELIKLEQSKRSKMGSSSYSSAKPKLENKYKANSNSNKKIKIYELNKKLEGRQKEYKDRHVIYLGRLRKQEEQMAMIGDTNQDIRKQRDNSNELERLHASLVADINRIQEKCNEQQAMLLNEKQVLSLYRSQKIRRIQEIKKLKKIINQSAEKTEPDDMAYSVNELDQYQADGAKIKPLAFRLELTEHNSPNLLSENRKQEEILIQDEVEEQALIPAYISFKKSHNHRLTQSPQMNSLNDSKAEHYSKEIGKSYEQLENEVILLEEKIQKDKKLYQNLIESVSLVKRGNRNLEASAKHMIVTLDLLKNRLENVVRNNEQETRQLVDNIEKYNGIYSKMRAKDGERGELRGKLGIKVENTRILGIINEQITLDLLKVGDKAPLLKNLSAQCFQLVKRFAEPERLISQNLNDY